MSFSATITSELRDILDNHIGNDYVHIKISTEVVASKVDHAFIKVPHGKRREMLDHFLEKHKTEKIIIFTQTKQTTIDVAQNLANLKMPVCELHGDIDQRRRNQTIKAFKS
jgi:ATP-dependent RNA helicase DeaD